MKDIFDRISVRTSRITTHMYSTSFSLGIRVFKKRYHEPIYAIYGFVRFGDEIVDSFHGFDKKKLLQKFRNDTFEAIKDGISLNPILNSFQAVVNRYNIDHELIEHFLNSMEMDLDFTRHDTESFRKYILGSAEVVGLMCLQVFVNGDREWYDSLKPQAMALGSAFQKVNFLRDLNADKGVLGRSYFPGLDVTMLDEQTKNGIIEEIEKEFQFAYQGIMQLPHGARFGVYVAFVYYQSLLRKIKRTHSSVIMSERVRIPNREKYGLLISSAFRHAVNLMML
jgi:15-cis-phytoene synthase